MVSDGTTRHVASMWFPMYRTDITVSTGECPQHVMPVTCGRRAGWRVSTRRASAQTSQSVTTYAETRAPDRRLRLAASVPTVRCPLRPDSRRRRVRRESLPVARREVSRAPVVDAVPDLPQGAGHAGVLGVRRPARPGVGVGAYRRRDRLPRRDRRRIHRARRRGLPYM